MKNPLIPSGIEPAQYLNHCATAVLSILTLNIQNIFLHIFEAKTLYEYFIFESTCPTQLILLHFVTVTAYIVMYTLRISPRCFFPQFSVESPHLAPTALPQHPALEHLLRVFVP